MICVQPSAFFLMAALILLLPLDWLTAAILAAIVHELGHLAAIYALGSRPERISIGGAGAKIHTGPLEGKAEAFSTAAGPAASFLLLSVCRFFPKLALCGLIQGMFNLIPVYPMDGGRLLRCLLRRLCPRKAEGVFHFVQCLILFILLILSWLAGIRRKDGFAPLLVCISALSRVLFAKIPCKSA